MVLKHLQVVFYLKDLVSGFTQNFQVYSHVVTGHIPRSIVWAFGLAMFLALAKPFKSIQPIMRGNLTSIGEHSFMFAVS
jgi:hypothetical protein